MTQPRPETQCGAGDQGQQQPALRHHSETAGFFRHLCMAEEVPVQSFVVRSDMGCGSTIGPITASHLGVRTVDIGLPTFAMHSIRELCGSHDLAHLVKVLGAFYASRDLP